jgi:predicted dithiol-disulfide oxidoreductase (DUF899 family)
MSLPELAFRDDWLVARPDLRAEDPELARRGDELYAERGMPPMFEIPSDYAFIRPEDAASPPELFDDRP